MRLHPIILLLSLTTFLVGCAADEVEEPDTGVESQEVVIARKLAILDDLGGGCCGGCTDYFSPSTPSNVAISTPVGEQNHVTFSGSTDDCSGVSGYRIYRCSNPSCTGAMNAACTVGALGCLVGTASGTSIDDTHGLPPSTPVSYKVEAYDFAGRTSTGGIGAGMTAAFTGTGGNVQSSQTAPVTGARDVAIVGNLMYVVGQIDATSFRIIKYTSGSETWSQTFTTVSGGAQARAIAATADYVYVTGSFDGTLDMHTPALGDAVAGLGSDVFILQLTPSGGTWAWQAYDSNDENLANRNEEGTTIRTSSDGYVYVGGSGGSFDGLTAINPIGFLMKLAENDFSNNCGNCWGVLPVGDPNDPNTSVVINGLAVSGSTLAIIGTFVGTISMSQSTTLNTSTYPDIFALSMETTGWNANGSWAAQFGHPDRIERGNGIAIDPSGAYLYLTGDIAGARTSDTNLEPCASGCSGPAMNVSSDDGKTIFLVSVSVAAGVGTSLPEAVYAKTFRHFTDSTADSTAYGVAANAGGIAIAGELGNLGANGVNFGTTPLITGGTRNSTAFIASFANATGSNTWARSTHGSGASNRLSSGADGTSFVLASTSDAVENASTFDGQPSIVGAYVTRFSQ